MNTLIALAISSAGIGAGIFVGLWIGLGIRARRGNRDDLIADSVVATAFLAGVAVMALAMLMKYMTG